MRLILGDCLDKMQAIPDGSIDAIIADPPYGTTACKWDSVIPFEPMWRELRRVIKPNGAIVLFGSEPFSSALRMSNIKEYKYDWVWEKEQAANFAAKKYRPGKTVENIPVFSIGRHRYHPIMIKRDKPIRIKSSFPSHDKETVNGVFLKTYERVSTHTYPDDILRFQRDRVNRLHPTQKPVALLEYLIRTYTNEGETVLDFTMGSGTTGVAAVNTGREFIGIELDETYFGIARERIEQAEKVQQPELIR